MRTNGTVVVAMLTILSGTPYAAPGNAKGRSWAPVGKVWWCYQVQALSSSKGDRISSCKRSEQACVEEANSTKSNVADLSLEFGRDDFRCRSSPKAAGFTFRDVVQDYTAARYALRLQDCQDARLRYLDVDHDEVSECTIDGAVEPSHFNLARVPDGKSWYCPSGKNHACSRSSEVCADDLKDFRADGNAAPASCKQQAFAFGLTSRSKLYVRATEQACLELVGEFPEASNCERI